MVIELDLGFDLDEEEQECYDDLASTIERRGHTVWRAGHRWGGSTAPDVEPIPIGVLAYAEPDSDASSPREDETYTVIVSTSDTSALAGTEAPCFLDIVFRHHLDADAEILVLNEAREQYGAVAVAQRSIEHHDYWAMATAAGVRAWFGALDTPERVEGFLALDVAATGRTLVEQELADFHDWAVGDVWTVTATYFPTGKTESLCNCRDTYPYAYLRSIAGELAREVAP